jgi:DivIVA domain-containing protein
MEEPRRTGGAPADGPRFRVVWRGYHRHQVDEYVRMVRDLAAQRAEAETVDRELSSIDRQLGDFFTSKDAPRLFDLVLRGCDPDEVDRYLEQFDR